MRRECTRPEVGSDQVSRISGDSVHYPSANAHSPSLARHKLHKDTHGYARRANDCEGHGTPGIEGNVVCFAESTQPSLALSIGLEICRNDVWVVELSDRRKAGTLEQTDFG